MKTKSSVQQSGTAHPKWVLWGYAGGGALCFAGLLVLSVALGQVLRSATRGIVRANFPGTKTLELRKPGLYLGVVPLEGDVSQAASLRVSLSELDTAAFVPLQQTPGARVAMAGGKPGLVLFQAEVPSAGRYMLNAAYPSGTSGPTMNAFLLHESIGHNRADIAAGVIVCLVLAGAGLYVILRTRRAAVPLSSVFPGKK
jgi:hypothetical protein